MISSNIDHVIVIGDVLSEYYLSSLFQATCNFKGRLYAIDAFSKNLSTQTELNMFTNIFASTNYEYQILKTAIGTKAIFIPSIFCALKDLHYISHHPLFTFESKIGHLKIGLCLSRKHFQKDSELMKKQLIEIKNVFVSVRDFYLLSIELFPFESNCPDYLSDLLMMIKFKSFTQKFINISINNDYTLTKNKIKILLKHLSNVDFLICSSFATILLGALLKLPMIIFYDNSTNITSLCNTLNVKKEQVCFTTDISKLKNMIFDLCKNPREFVLHYPVDNNTGDIVTNKILQR
jgi:hypothetical protein